MSATPNAVDDHPSADPRAEHLRASPPLLPWPALDRLTRVHPVVPAVLYGPVIVLFGALGIDRMGAGSTLLWAVVGYALWTLT